MALKFSDLFRLAENACERDNTSFADPAVLYKFAHLRSASFGMQGLSPPRRSARATPSRDLILGVLIASFYLVGVVAPAAGKLEFDCWLLFSRQGVVAPAAGNLEFLTGLIVSQ